MIADGNEADATSDNWRPQFTHLRYVRVAVAAQHLRINHQLSHVTHTSLYRPDTAITIANKLFRNATLYIYTGFSSPDKFYWLFFRYPGTKI